MEWNDRPWSRITTPFERIYSVLLRVQIMMIAMAGYGRTLLVCFLWSEKLCLFVRVSLVGMVMVRDGSVYFSILESIFTLKKA